MAINSKKNVERNVRTYLAKDFSTFKVELLRNARTFFPDKISDFSEASVGGLLMDMCAVVGDSLTFYLDHAFKELDPATAVETSSVEAHLRSAGVDITGASPASVNLSITITTPAEKINGEYYPKLNSLPLMKEGTSFSTSTNVEFILVEDVDFRKKNPSGNFYASYNVRSLDSLGKPDSFDMTMTALAVSGKEVTENIPVTSFTPFLRVGLQNAHVTSILSVTDSVGNEYFEVESLSQDTVFKAVDNTAADRELVSNNLEMMPATYRYVKETSITDRRTALMFGAGDADVFDDDILPDPSDVSLELFGKKVFSKFSIDPNSLLKTQTLGIAPPANSDLTIRYRYGGGINHNVPVGSITEVSKLLIEFRNKPSTNDALSVRQSIRCNNHEPSRGGANAPTIDALRNRIRPSRISQNRIVTREDLLARIYSLPSRFGSVYRAAIETNSVNPLASILYLCSLDANGNLSVSPDTLKLNLSKYINEHRLISDAIDILDVKVINFGIKYEVLLRQDTDKISIINSINSRLAAAVDRKFFQIGQPIIFDDILNIIINFQEVISLSSLRVFPIVGETDGRTYSTATFPFEENTKLGIIRGPQGSIFEMRFPAFDISGIAL